MKSQSEFNDTLHCFCKEIVVPLYLVMDFHMAQNNNRTKKIYHKIGTTLRILEAGTPWANRVELYISIFKEAVCRDLRFTDAPMMLWDYCIKRQSLIHKAVPHPILQYQEMTPMKPLLTNRAISLIYVALDGTSGSTKETQKHSQPQNNA